MHPRSSVSWEATTPPYATISDTKPSNDMDVLFGRTTASSTSPSIVVTE